MTAQLSREHVEEFISSIESDPVLRETRAFELKLAKHVLAGMSAKSRKLFTCTGCGAEGLDEPLESKCHCNEDGAHWAESVVFTAPPAPVAVHDAYELIAEAWRLMDGQNPQTAEWHSAASRYLNAHGRAAMQAEPVTESVTDIAEALRGILKLYPDDMTSGSNHKWGFKSEVVDAVAHARKLLAAAPAAPDQEV